MAASVAEYIEVRWRVTGSGESWSTPMRSAPLAEIRVAELDRTQQYDFEVRAVSNCGAASVWVPSNYTVPGAPAPTSVDTLTAQSLADGVHLGWTSLATPAAGVESSIERSANGTTGWAERARVRSTAYTDPETSGSTFYYRVRYVDFNGNFGAYSPVVTSSGLSMSGIGADASAAAADAAAALLEAEAATTALANIASDNILSAGEKPPVIRDVSVINAEQAGIDAQASAYGITTTKTAYDGKVSTLNSYLATLTAPTLWSDLGGDTTIDGPTFRSKFASVYTTRQALLNAIYAAAKAKADAAQSTATAALGDAADAQAAADGKIVTFYQATMPTTGTLGDLWFDSDAGNKQYRHNGTTFVVTQDTAIGNAVTAAAGAQATADGKVTTFYTSSTPVAEGVGDLWVDTGNGKRLKRWSGSAWVDIQDAAIAAAARAASAASTAATNAKNAADAANATLANISSDGILSPGEKPSVIQDYNVIVAEQAGIDAQASAYGITTTKTAYDNARTALTSYLATLTSPVLWSNLAGDTAIVGTTFRQKFADVYTTRQALLNAIYAAAKAKADAAQGAADTAQTTATQGVSLASNVPVINGGFDTLPIGYGWAADGGSGWYTDTSNISPGVGPNCARHNGGAGNGAYRNLGSAACLPGQVYKAQGLVKAAGANGLCYVYISWCNAAGSEIGSQSGTTVTGTRTAGSYAVGTAPAGTVIARTCLGVASHTAGYYLVDNVLCSQYPSNVGEVPDGGGRYAVNQVDSNGLAIIDFSQPGQVNKSLRYIADDVGSGRFAAAQAGADKTSSNTAADFAGRGYFARLNSADLGDAAFTGKNLGNIADGGGRYGAAQAGADKTSSNTAYDTARVFGASASAVSDGAGRAQAGFDTSGYLTAGRHSLNLLRNRNTSVLSDDANLGLKANWSYVTGSGRPADNADVTRANVALGANTVVNPSGANGTSAPHSVVGGGTLESYIHDGTLRASEQPGGSFLFTGALGVTEIIYFNGPHYSSSPTYGPFADANPGEIWYGSIWAGDWGNGNAGSLRVEVQFRRADGSSLGASGMTVTANNGDLDHLSVYGVAPAGTGRVGLVLKCYMNSTGTHVILQQAELRRATPADAGSGVVLGNQLNAPNSLTLAYGAVQNTASISATSAGAITVNAFTVYMGGASVSYSTRANAVTGLAQSTTYTIYCHDKGGTGGVKTWYATSSVQAAMQQGDDIVIAGYVTIPTSGTGTGGGGGGGSCVSVDAWVIRRDGDSEQFARAGDIEVGDYLKLADGEWGEVSYSNLVQKLGVRVVNDAGEGLTCSLTAPLRTAGMNDVLAANAAGCRLESTAGVFEVAAVRSAGMITVQHITCQNDYFLTGDAQHLLLSHHNAKPPPPPL